MTDRLSAERPVSACIEKVRWTAMPDLPDYNELPLTSLGVRSGWGLFGEGDSVGLLNLITPDRVAAAARLVRSGQVFPLNAPYDAFTPSLAPHRSAPRHTILHEAASIHFDDVHDNYFPQGSSQWDGLGHVGAAPDMFYNGASEDDVLAGRRNTVDHWARRGIVGRGILLDVSNVLASTGEPFDPGSRFEISVDHLEEARAKAGVEFEPGDVLVLHTGFASWFIEQDRTTRESVRRSLHTVGLDPSEDMCRYLWNAHVAALGSDTFAVEAFPPDLDKPFGFIHRVLIGHFGMALGELWSTKALADACAEDGAYTFLFASAPIHVPGGIGSPANALAIK